MSISSDQIKGYTRVTLREPDPLNGFPLLSIDRDSYIAGLEIQSGIDFEPEGNRHCISIGKGCSLADAITFMIDLNHDYNSVSQGDLSFLHGLSRPSKVVRKGTILIQNDVWIGHGATIMAGATLHNGCVVAAESVVTKDVPPYAIVGGNPAKVLKYRFDAEIIDGFQKIAWWNWEPQVLQARRKDFLLPASKFIEKYLPEAESIRAAPLANARSKKVVLFIPDFSDPFPLYPRIFGQYFTDDHPDQELLIYLSEQDSTPRHLNILDEILQRHEEKDCDVVLQTGETWDEHILFQLADFFITTRSRETVYRTGLADLYHVKILYGTDEPLFHM